MAIPLYLAMTPGEFQSTQKLPSYLGWMSCHFSPSGKGLSSLPRQLPPGSLLILDDRIPPQEHHPEYIKEQLADTLSTLECCGLLLDFQRPDDPQTAGIVDALLELPFPVGVSSCYGEKRDCPIFLPPCPVTKHPDTYLSPWKGREIWLEMSAGAVCARINAQGCHTADTDGTDFPHADAALFCHYRIETAKDEIRFHISRTKTDQKALMELAESFGVTKAIGLYQELVYW